MIERAQHYWKAMGFLKTAVTGVGGKKQVHLIEYAYVSTFHKGGCSGNGV